MVRTYCRGSTKWPGVVMRSAPMFHFGKLKTYMKDYVAATKVCTSRKVLPVNRNYPIVGGLAACL